MSDWWTPLEDVVARPHPLAVLPLPIRILAALLFVTAFVVGSFAFAYLAIGAYMGWEGHLAVGLIYSMLTALLGLAGGGVLLSRLWGWWLAIWASFATVTYEVIRLSVSPPYGIFYSGPQWLATVVVNWSLLILSAATLVWSIVVSRRYRGPTKKEGNATLRTP